jgi:hypothetical protein
LAEAKSISPTRQPWQFGDRHYAVPKSTVAANTQSCKRVFITGFADK